MASIVAIPWGSEVAVDAVMSYWVVARYLLDVIFFLSILGTQTLIISDILLVVSFTPLVAAVVVEVVKGAIARFAEP
jgi:hypothetical protein